MPITLDTIRNFFTGHKPEEGQPAFAPASGQDVEPATNPLATVATHDSDEKEIAYIQEFGTVHQSNVLLPDGRLGHSERRSRFELAEREDGQFDLNLVRRSYLFVGNQVVSQRDLAQGTRGPDQFGPFPDRAAAELFSNNYLSDYNQTASEEHAAAVEWQQEQDHEAYFGRDEDDLTDLLRSQEENIRQEWQTDLAFSRQNQHDLETYFAGKIDQHNTMIEMAVEANPKLQETLPPQINYEQLRSEVQQQIQQQQQGPAQAMEIAI